MSTQPHVEIVFFQVGMNYAWNVRGHDGKVLKEGMSFRFADATEDALAAFQAVTTMPVKEVHMTATEYAKRWDRALTLRYFPSKKTGGEPSTLPWRASFSNHYYTSDSCRLVGVEDDNRSQEGWGATPDDACLDLMQATRDALERRLEGLKKSWREVADEIEVWR